MAIGVLIVGDEILSGRRRDKHLTQVIEALSKRGMRLDWARYCADDRPRLIEALQQSFAAGDIVFSFGGIGATPDDHTRQSAAAALGQALLLHPDAAREIDAAIQSRRGVPATPQQLMMGEFPAEAALIPNPFNGIPGFTVAQHWFLPGFPEMSWPMLDWVLDTHYQHLHHADTWHEASVAVMDTNESALIDLMHQLQNDFGVTAFSLPNLGSATVPRHIDFGVKGEAEAVTNAMCVLKTYLSERAMPWRELNDLPK